MLNKECFPLQFKQYANNITEILNCIHEKKSHATLTSNQLFLGFRLFSSLLFGKNQDIVFCFFYDSYQEKILLHYEKNIPILNSITEISENHSKIDINLNTLEPYMNQGFLFFVMAILQEKGIYFSSQNLEKINLFKNIDISIDGTKTMLEWFFPYSGIAIIIKEKNTYLAIVIYGGKKPSCKILPLTEEKCLLKTIKKFRHDNNISLSFGFKYHFLNDIFNKKVSFFNLLHLLKKNYSTNWGISLPTEVDDFFLNFTPLITQYFTKSAIRKYIDTKNNILHLAKNYYKNLQKYWKKKPIYVQLYNDEKSITLALKNSVKEVDHEADFQINIGSFNTWTSWLNDKSIRLFIRFLDAITPIGWVHNISSDEIMIKLQLIDEKKRPYELFLIGSNHKRCNSNWAGDFYSILLHKNKILFQEKIEKQGIIFLQKENSYEIHFPFGSFLQGSSFLFHHDSVIRVNRGLCSLISETSVFDEITPGIRNSIIKGYLKKENLEVFVDSNKYSILDGDMVVNIANGKEITYDVPLQYTHAQVMLPDVYYFLSHARLPTKSRWDSFVKKTEIQAIEISSDKTTKYNKNDFFFPICTDKNAILSLKEKDHFKKNNQGIKFHFQILQAWIIPHIIAGNMKIRIFCIAESKKQTGIAMLEYPFFLAKIFNSGKVIFLEIKRNQKQIEFYIEQSCVFRIRDPAFSIYNKWKIR